MIDVGLRELRQNASELVRRAENGETMTITVAGRPAAVLAPVAARTWRRWADVAEALAVPVDGDWASDMELLDQGPADPWGGR